MLSLDVCMQGRCHVKFNLTAHMTTARIHFYSFFLYPNHFTRLTSFPNKVIIPLNQWRLINHLQSHLKDDLLFYTAILIGCDFSTALTRVAPLSSKSAELEGKGVLTPSDSWSWLLSGSPWMSCSWHRILHLSALYSSLGNIRAEFQKT